MIFLAPVYLIVAGAIAAGVVALHFLSTREPDTDLLPTVRFIPKVPVQATTITMRFSDPWLLVLRVLLILLLGAALARPLLHPLSAPVARIALVDVSRAVASTRELADSARGYVEGAAAVLFFDREAREVGDGAMDSLEVLAEGAPVSGDGLAGEGTGARGGTQRWTRAEKGSLSSAMIAALRTASRLRDGADSLQLVVISPFAREERDAATERMRALWPGRIEVVRVGGAGPADGLPPEVPPEAAAESPTQASRVRIEWADSAASQLWTEREIPDTLAGVRANDAVMVYPFERRWRPAAATPSALSTGTPSPTENPRVYARWMDGEPAAFERATADGCVRSIAIPLPTEGDAILRPAFQRFLSGLDDPCGEPGDPTPLSDEFLTAFAGDGPLAPASEIGRQVKRVTPAVPWILALALLVALAEHWARRRLAKGSDRGPASGRSRRRDRGGATSRKGKRRAA